MDTLYTIGLILGPALMIYGLLLHEHDRKPAHRDFHYRLKHNDNEHNTCTSDRLRDTATSRDHNRDTGLPIDCKDEK